MKTYPEINAKSSKLKSSNAFDERSEMPVGSVPKTDDTRIRAKLIRKGSDIFVDIREYVENERYTGPTKKGIRFHSENFDAFTELVGRIGKVLSGGVGII
ncbi:transcriptional coactivator p15/PC4 family protein [bacterium]|nr:transcriptional coactivator p15/PC4 family protein [candidate division CSSED10-310 bacterium]